MFSFSHIFLILAPFGFPENVFHFIFPPSIPLVQTEISPQLLGVFTLTFVQMLVPRIKPNDFGDPLTFFSNTTMRLVLSEKLLDGLPSPAWYRWSFMSLLCFTCHVTNSPVTSYPDNPSCTAIIPSLPFPSPELPRPSPFYSLYLCQVALTLCQIS